MSRVTAILLALFVASGCVTGSARPSDPPATAEVRLLSMSPPSGSDISTDTVLLAEIEYAIENFKPGVHYYVAPLFASTERSGTTFNMLDRIADAPKIAQPTGTVTVRYSISRELESRNLQRPVTLWFYVMEQIGAGKTRVIGTTEQLTFRTAG
jgi:hypothetical protein